MLRWGCLSRCGLLRGMAGRPEEACWVWRVRRPGLQEQIYFGKPEEYAQA